MHSAEPFTDIHCHILPGVDDGARSWDEACALAPIAVADGMKTIIATPHQGGTFPHNSAEAICRRVDECQTLLDEHGIALRILPGADVRFGQNLMRDILR